MAENENQENIGPRIVRATLDELRIYEISEAELETIERGGPESLYLNLAIFFISTAVSFTITLTTTDIKSPRLFEVFVVVTVVFYVASAILGALWIRGCRSKKKITKIIRERMPAKGQQIEPDADKTTKP
ncbi:MAG: hypothetical protein HY298_23225 [Verrucomicrobia bacterium]|nr:hypothetical protein [Verrucomicrobiota bacterium]